MNDVENAFMMIWETIATWTHEVRDLQHSVHSFIEEVVNDIGDEVRSCRTSAVMKAHRCARSAFGICTPDTGIVDRDCVPLASRGVLNPVGGRRRFHFPQK